MLGETCIQHDMGVGCRSRNVNRVIADLADVQHGVVARRQLLAAGITRREIGGRLARALLHPIYLGVYAVGHRQLRREGRWMAAVLACGGGAVLSHLAAAQLWRLLPGSTALPEVTRPRRFRPRPGIVAHCSALPADEITVVEGIPVTDLARTLFDLAAFVKDQQLENAINEAEVRGLTGRLSVPDLIERYSRRPGSRVLRRILRDERSTAGVTRRELEARFAEALDRAEDLPRPRRNAKVHVRGRFFEVDCLWSKQRLIVELDGRAVHGTRRAFERDRERDRLLAVEGWQVVRVTWRQLEEDGEAVVADLRRLLL